MTLHATKNPTIDIRTVCAMCGGASRPTVYRRIEDGSLPRPVKFGRKVFWFENEIIEALNALRSRAA
jgi:predicted DNA-binding transcriptional regulator AlpA